MTNGHHPVSPGDVADRAVVAGFVNPNLELGYGATKVLAGRLRARMVAVDAWVITGERLCHKVLADRLGISGSGLSYQFTDQNELYAFPPPELARSLSSATAPVTNWDEVAALTVPVFEALESNPQGRVLMAGLVRVHRRHPDLCNTFTIPITAVVHGRSPAFDSTNLAREYRTVRASAIALGSILVLGWMVGAI